MKKFLSLVLALVMTMSLVTVSAGAKDYADADDIKYVEAVDVLSALGVLEGDENGFRPNDTLKRSEAAKIIAALNLTPKTAAGLSADTAPFADVAKSHWAAGYIAEGVDSGIIAGVGDNKFNPDGQLTGYAYLKMLLVCLGYDAAVESMTGANWSVNVAKLAKKAGLTDGNDDFVGSAAVTREEAALYALNALQAKTVEYESKGTNITINGAVINSGASQAKYVEDEDGNYVTYKTENYSKLIKEAADDTEDAYGRPAITWSYKGEEIGTYAKTPVLVYTAKKDADDIKADLKAEGYKKVAKFDKDGELTGYTTITDDTYDGLTKNGKVVEFYADEFTNEETGKVTNAVYAVVEIETNLAKVTDIKSDKKGTADEDEREIVLEGLASKLGLCAEDDDVVANFEALYDEVEEDDYLLYTLSKDGKTFVSVEIPEIVEGKITKVTTDNSIVVSGTTYKMSQNNTGFATSKKTQKVWLDSYGYAIKGEESDTTSDVVYLVKSYDAQGEYGEDTDYAQVVTTEGETQILTLATTKDAGGKDLIDGALYTYTVNSDDEATLKRASDDKDVEIAALNVAIDDEDVRVKGVGYFADDVKFIYIKDSGSKLKVAVEEGVQTVAKAKSAVLNGDGDIATVFVVGEPDTATDSDELAFMKSTTVKGNAYDDNDKSYNLYQLYFEGKSSNVMVKNKEKVAENQFFSYSVTDDGVYTLKEQTTYAIDEIAKDKYVLMSEVVDDSKEMVNVLLDADAEIFDTTDNGITTLGELADQWAEADEKDDDSVNRVKAYAAYDADEEVVLCIYIVK